MEDDFPLQIGDFQGPTVNVHFSAVKRHELPMKSGQISRTATRDAVRSPGPAVRSAPRAAAPGTTPGDRDGDRCRRSFWAMGKKNESWLGTGYQWDYSFHRSIRLISVLITGKGP